MIRMMNCPKCNSVHLATAPAQIQLYTNRALTMSHPPVSPTPEVLLCEECGWAEFRIPQSWLEAGWFAKA